MRSTDLQVLPADQNKFCAHDKNRKHAELWVRTNLFNVFVMYALDSAHEKVRRMKQSRSFPLYSTSPVEKNGSLTQTQICRT